MSSWLPVSGPNTLVDLLLNFLGFPSDALVEDVHEEGSVSRSASVLALAFVEGGVV